MYRTRHGDQTCDLISAVLVGIPDPFRAAAQYITGLGSMYGAGQGNGGKGKATSAPCCVLFVSRPIVVVLKYS
jgi:hypothetical protein